MANICGCCIMHFYKILILVHHVEMKKDFFFKRFWSLLSFQGFTAPIYQLQDKEYGYIFNLIHGELKCLI